MQSPQVVAWQTEDEEEYPVGVAGRLAARSDAQTPEAVMVAVTSSGRRHFMRPVLVDWRG